MIIAVAKLMAEIARSAAAPRTGHIRSRRMGLTSSALACAIAFGSSVENGLPMAPSIAGVGGRANRRAWRTRRHGLDRRP